MMAIGESAGEFATMWSCEVPTGAGRLAACVSAGRRDAILLLHGNSMCKEAFEGLLQRPLARVYRFIAIDLPGHGGSERAADPGGTYALSGFADACLEALRALDARDAIVCGWSLGGHVALEMMARCPTLRGALTLGAPPTAPGPAAFNAFVPSEALELLCRETLTKENVESLLATIFPAGAPEFARRGLALADGRVRSRFVESVIAGRGADPSGLLARPDRPVAVIAGERDPFVRQDVLETWGGPGLWRGRVQMIPGAGHAPFLDAPEAFDAILLAFLRDAARLRTNVGGRHLHAAPRRPRTGYSQTANPMPLPVPASVR